MEEEKCDPSGSLLTYSHSVDVLRTYSLIYIWQTREWVSQSTFTARKFEETHGREAVVIRGIMYEKDTVVIAWDVKRDTILEGNQYTISYITPCKSACSMYAIQTYETTFKTVICHTSAVSENVFNARRCWNLENLKNYKQFGPTFNEVDMVAMVESLSIDNMSAILVDDKGENVTIVFPKGITGTGVHSKFQVGSYIALINLEIISEGDTVWLEFGLRSNVICEPGTEYSHLMEPLEMLKLNGIDLENMSGFSDERQKAYSFPVRVCDNRASMMSGQGHDLPISSPKSKVAIHLVIRKELLLFFTKLNVPLTEADMSSVDNIIKPTKSGACISSDNNQSLGVIGIGVINGLETDDLEKSRSIYVITASEILAEFGFQPLVTRKDLTSWIWINLGSDENRIAVEISFNVYGAKSQAKITFFSDIFDCINRNEQVKSIFLFPNITIICSNMYSRTQCPCKVIPNIGVALARTCDKSAGDIPHIGPLLMECSVDMTVKSKLSMFQNGVLVKSIMLEVRDILSFEIQKQLGIYDKLTPITVCNPYFYCDKCLTNTIDPMTLEKLKSFGVIDYEEDNRKCCNQFCNERTQLYILPVNISALKNVHVGN